jgi:uncharacterized peroxidase-related enzyme
MSRLATPESIEAAPEAAHASLRAVEKQLGVTPNLFRVVANSPAALQGYLGLNGALAHGTLDAATRERLALTVAEINGCDYCLSAHSYLGKNVAKLDDGELERARDAASGDPKVAAALQFAAAVTRRRGHVGDAELQAVKAAGYSDGQIVEIILHVALNTLTNYVNEVADTAIDFPRVTQRPR